MTLESTVILLLTALPMVQSEMFYLHNMLRNDVDAAPFVQTENGHRFLQLQASLRNETCEPAVDGRFICTVATTITSATTNKQVEISATVGCDETSPGNTLFRQAKNCECTAGVMDVTTGDFKLCACVVCPAAVGDGVLAPNNDHPIAVDCTEQDTVLIDDCVSMGCDLGCNKTCATECQASEDDCVPCPEQPTQEPQEPTPLTKIVFNTTTTESCEKTNATTLSCTQQARIVLPEQSAPSDIAMTVECQVDPSMGFLSFRQAQKEAQKGAHSCSCSVNVTHANGQPGNCLCNVCPEGFGPQPIGLVCSDDPTFGDCDYVDCNSACMGTCMYNCSIAREDCPLCVEPTLPPASCYDLQTFSTPLNSGENTAQYYGIKFNLQAKEMPLELIGLEIPANVSEINNDTTVDVSINKNGYDRGSGWERTATMKALVSPKGDRLILSPGDAFSSVSFEAGQVIGFYIQMQGPWLKANLVDDGTQGVDFVSFPGFGLVSTDDDQYDIATNPYFAGKFLYRSVNSCKDCPVCPTLLDMNTTTDECQTTDEHFICNRQTRVTAPENSNEYSDLDIEVQCDLPAPGDDNFRAGTNCSCSVEVTDHLGNPRNCECSVCTDGFGGNDVAIHCQDNFVVGECASIDCTGECNGVCSTSCDESGADCALCAATQTPDTIATETPTVSPAPPPTAAPTKGEVSYSFASLTVRLGGGKEVSAEGFDAFNNVTAEFYRLTLRPAASSRRHLQTVDFAAFDTEVTAKDQNLDAAGNTIIYDQVIRFTTATGTLNEDDAKYLLLLQLTNPETKKEYLEMLKNAHPDFDPVTEINPTEDRSTTPQNDNDSGGLDLLWIIIIAVGGAIFCCCFCALLFALCSARDKEEKDTDYFHEDDVDQNAPEGPMYDHSEKSGDEIFSNETDHKTVPYGQDDGDDFQRASAPMIDDVHEESEADSSYRGDID